MFGGTQAGGGQSGGAGREDEDDAVGGGAARERAGAAIDADSCEGGLGNWHAAPDPV